MIIAQLQRDPIVNLYIKHPVVFDSIQFPRTTAPTAAAAAAACRTIDNRTHLVPLALHRVPGIGESGGATHILVCPSLLPGVSRASTPELVHFDTAHP